MVKTLFDTVLTFWKLRLYNMTTVVVYKRRCHGLAQKCSRLVARVQFLQAPYMDARKGIREIN